MRSIFRKTNLYLASLMSVMIVLLGCKAACVKPPIINIMSPGDSEQVKACPLSFSAEFQNVTPEDLFTIVVAVNDVEISHDGVFEIDGQEVKIRNYSKTTEGVSFSACDMPIGNHSFSIRIGEQGCDAEEQVSFDVDGYYPNCLEIKRAHDDAMGGDYTIDPGDGFAPLSILCDMSSEDGGGWTLVGMFVYPGHTRGIDGWTSGEGVGDDYTSPEKSFILSDQLINTLVTANSYKDSKVKRKNDSLSVKSIFRK